MYLLPKSITCHHIQVSKRSQKINILCKCSFMMRLLFCCYILLLFAMHIFLVDKTKHFLNSYECSKWLSTSGRTHFNLHPPQLVGQHVLDTFAGSRRHQCAQLLHILLCLEVRGGRITHRHGHLRILINSVPMNLNMVKHPGSNAFVKGESGVH